MSPKPTYEALEMRLREIEQSLRVLESRFNDAQGIAHIGSWEAFPETEELFWSDEMFRILGHEPGKIIPSFNEAKRHIHPDDLSPYIDKRESALSEKRPYDIEFRAIRKDGTVRHLHSIANIELDDDGNIIRRYGTLQDITYQEQIRDALREKETRLKTAQRIGRIGSWDLDLETRKRLWSDEMFRIFGYEPGGVEPTDTLVQNHVHPEDKSRYMELHEAALRERLALDWEFRIIRKDGAVRMCHLIAEIESDPLGNPERYFGTFQDITERKQMEAEIQRSEQRYRTLVENINDVAYSLNNEGVIEYISPVVQHKTGFSKEDIVNRSFMEFIHPDDLPKMQSVFQQKISGNGPISTEFRIRKNDGSYLWIRASGRRRIKNGQADGLSGIWTDIDALKHTEQELIKSRDELDKRVKERTKELEVKTENLEEANTALGVLIKKREEDKAELEERILANSKELVIPYIKKLETTTLDDLQKAYVSILVSNLHDIISPFSSSLTSGIDKLTSSEMQVSDLIKHGKRTKEIAELLNLSIRTIESHRKNIRRKLGLSNKRANLRSYLLSIK